MTRLIRLTTPVVLLWCVFALVVGGPSNDSACAQDAPPRESGRGADEANVVEDEAPSAPDVVEVEPAARDEEIVARLERIYEATGWFEDVHVEVDEGVAFLQGRTDESHYKEWAGELAQKTRDVVAVVNQIDVALPEFWNFQPAVAGLRALGRDMVAGIPYFGMALLILGATFAAAVAVTRGLRSALCRRIRVPLLRNVIARGVGILVILLGLYFVLKVCGLTRLALTVLGGTGLLGLILGIAFRDITENFLASILLSVQAPFRNGDFIELAGVSGFVQQLNVRSTILMAPTGQHVQLPNAVVYKSTIRNFTSNPNRREEFTIGIGYDASVPHAQEIALAVLDEHPGVLKSPEPWVLVDNFGGATVNLRIYFWLDGSRYSNLKVRSAIMRLVKSAFQGANISIPDEAREIIFPRGVPVQMVPGGEAANEGKPALSSQPHHEADAVEAEGGLDADAEQIKGQARQARTPEDATDLLPSARE